MTTYVNNKADGALFPYATYLKGEAFDGESKVTVVAELSTDGAELIVKSSIKARKILGRFTAPANPADRGPLMEGRLFNQDAKIWLGTRKNGPKAGEQFFQIKGAAPAAQLSSFIPTRKAS